MLQDERKEQIKIVGERRTRVRTTMCGAGRKNVMVVAIVAIAVDRTAKISVHRENRNCNIPARVTLDFRA